MNLPDGDVRTLRSVGARTRILWRGPDLLANPYRVWFGTGRASWSGSRLGCSFPETVDLRQTPSSSPSHRFMSCFWQQSLLRRQQWRSPWDLTQAECAACTTCVDDGAWGEAVKGRRALIGAKEKGVLGRVFHPEELRRGEHQIFLCPNRRFQPHFRLHRSYDILHPTKQTCRSERWGSPGFTSPPSGWLIP